MFAAPMFIAERQKISLSYLEQLFGKLRRRRLVESVRGPGGGYYLAPTIIENLIGTCETLVQEGVGLLLIEQNLGVGNARLENGLLFERLFDPASLLDDLLRLFRIVPEIRLGNLLF